MKTSFVLCASALLALSVTTLSTSAVAGGPGSAPSSTSPKGKPAKKPEAKVAPQTEAAAAQAPSATPVALDTLPPPPAPATPAPAAAPAPATGITVEKSNPDHVASEPSPSASSDSSTKIEAVVGRTQQLGFAAGLRVGHRMANNVYVGGTAMVQTGFEGAFVTYPALELGYDAKLGDARFMPYVGVGPMIAIPTASPAPVQVSPLLYPGFAFHFESAKSPLIGGADVRFLYLTETDVAAFALNVTTGVRF